MLRSFVGGWLACAVVLGVAWPCAAQESAGAKIRVACVGDSNTFGHGVEDREKNCYPAQLERLLGDGYEVKNFGVSGSTLLKHGDMPYEQQGAYKQALDSQPNVVVIALGANDSKPQNWKFKDEFGADARAMVEAFRALPTKPRVILSLPLPAFAPMWGINDDVLSKELIPSLRQTAFDLDAEVVDLHTALIGKGDWFPDHIHPTAEGCAVMAKVLGRVIAFPADAGYDIEKNLAAAGIKSDVASFFGYRQLTFKLDDGRERIVVRPHRAAASKKIVWRGEFFGHEPQTDVALLQLGYHVVYVNARDMYGSPEAMAIWEKTLGVLKQAGLTGKITLIGMSRGGLYVYNWTALHPETVDVLYADAPVTDFKWWPAGERRTSSTKNEYQQLLRTYGFKDDDEVRAYKKNPVDNLEPLAKAGIPIIHVVGLADSVVPVDKNTDVVEERYKQLGGVIEVIRKPGVEHHPHSLANPGPIVDFILSHTKP